MSCDYYQRLALKCLNKCRSCNRDGACFLFLADLMQAGFVSLSVAAPNPNEALSTTRWQYQSQV